MLQEFTTGIMAGENLSEDQAERALELILKEETPDSAIASFLTALTVKGETAGEIAGFARVMRRQAISVSSRQAKLIDTAGTGGGVDTFNISTAAAFVIAGAGVPVAKHGNRAMTSRCGSADVLAALGVGIEKPAQVAERSLDEIGLAFMFAPLFHPAMKRVVRVRRELGHRTVFNLLGPLTNPAAAPFQIVGVYSSGLTELVGGALAALGTQRAWVVNSEDGLDELSVGGVARICDVQGTNIKSFDLDPTDFGFEICPALELAGGTPEENAGLIRAILEGRRSGPPREVVVLNAAAALHVADEGDFKQVIERARESIDSGAALLKLNQLVEMYRD